MIIQMIVHAVSCGMMFISGREISHVSEIVFAKHEYDILQSFPFPQTRSVLISIIIPLHLLVNGEKHRLDNSVFSSVTGDQFFLIRDDIFQDLYMVGKRIGTLHDAVPFATHSDGYDGFVVSASL